MHLSRTLRTWVAMLLLGALAFAHASISIAACPMERGAIGGVLAVETDAPCDCGTHATEFGPLYANRCLAHCTADLQLAGAAAVIVGEVGRRAWLPTPRASLIARRLRTGDPPALAAVPKRIQLHSFLA